MKENKKLILQRISKVICFLLIFNILLGIGSYIFIPKKNVPEYGVKNYYGNSFHGESRDSIDVVILGNSSAYKSITPLELWEEYGYTGFVCGTPAQEIQESYNILKNFLKEQKPQLVIYETEGIFNSFGKKIKSVYPLDKRSLVYLSNEVDAVNAVINTATENLCPFIKNHNRWSRITFDDFTLTPDYTQHYPTKGYVIATKTKPYTGNNDYMKPSDYTTPIQLTVRCYLDKIRDLCRENGAELILLSSPLPRAWNDERHRAVQNYADENGIKYIDTNLLIKDIGIDWKKDSSDDGYHLNIKGARKHTAFIGKYISENYKLTDHRGDTAYAQWNKDYEEYLKEIKRSQKKSPAPKSKVSNSKDNKSK